MRIYTVGHSSRNIEEFIPLLRKYGIELLVDVRSHPGSSRFPHFNKENLEKALSREGITYLHMPELGGLRRGSYADYVKTEEFKRALSKLIQLAGDSRTAIMCAERDWRNCHRRFISQELVKEGLQVIHILDMNRAEEHPKTIF